MEKTPFAKVLDYLKERGVSNNEVAETINAKLKEQKGYKDEHINELTKDDVRHIKNGKRKLSAKVIEGMKECYNINPNYLLGVSDVMLDKLDDDFKVFSSLVKDWTLIRESIGTDEKESVYLQLTMDKVLFDFLVKVGSANELKEKGLQSYNEKFQKHKEEYNSKKQEETEYADYILLPKKVLKEILVVGTKNEEIMELIDYSVSVEKQE